MATILDEILSSKHREVAAAQAELPLSALKERLTDCPPVRNFYQAVTAPAAKVIHVIAEVKKASPSAGLIRADFDPERIARIYEGVGAAALSVLTDENYFQGKLEYLPLVKQAVALPVLRKDFVVDAYQIYQARVWGADAVLLIAEALGEKEIAALAEAANSLDMTVLMEVHSEEALRKVWRAGQFPREGDRLLGINNRDLKRMVTDLDTSLRLQKIIGEVAGLVSESGIKSVADVKRLAEAGFHAVLVGETLMQAADIAGKFRELFGARDSN